MALMPRIAPRQRTSTELRHRKSVFKLSPDQEYALRAAVKRLVEISQTSAADQRGWWYHADIHRTNCEHSRANRYAPLFLPWHRAYLYRLELAMQTEVPGATLPWWDWPSSRQVGIPPLYDDPPAGPADNPLAHAPLWPLSPSWPERTSRHPAPAADLPDAEAVRKVMTTYPSFDDFSFHLEVDLHNAVHRWTGGEMLDPQTAGYDPLFWAHHTMVDRLWALWQVANSASGPSPAQRGIVLEPFNMTVGDVLDINTLGYEYAASTLHVDVN
jgi:tyrosinase